MSVNNPKKSHEAFSLPELMVAIGIIGFLTSIAAYTYPTYSVKSQITAATQVLDSYILAMQDFYTENSMMPASQPASMANYSRTSNDPISSISFSWGASPSVTATFGSNASKILQNNSITVQLVINNGNSSTAGNGMFITTCTTSSIPNDYLPNKCQS